jgi:hypothetical protein
MSRSHPNNSVQKRQRRARLIHSIYSWHRWLGLSVLLWVLMFAISGLLIEAAPALKLDSRKIQTNWVLDRYGVKQPQAVAQWALTEHQIDVWDQGASIGGQWLTEFNQQNKNVTGLGNPLGVLAVASASQLALYTYGGEFIDQLPGPKGQIEKVGMTADHQLVVQTQHGNFVADSDLLSWSATGADDIRWSQKQDMAEATTPAANHDISWERLLLDVHSGAFFGTVGRWLSRLAAVVMILLALSGFYTWFTRFARKPR